jgi:hypothetical protein
MRSIINREERRKLANPNTYTWDKLLSARIEESGRMICSRKSGW